MAFAALGLVSSQIAVLKEVFTASAPILLSKVAVLVYCQKKILAQFYVIVNHVRNRNVVTLLALGNLYVIPALLIPQQL